MPNAEGVARMSRPRMSLEENLTALFESFGRASADPEVAAARASATPQETYSRMAGQCPVRDLGDGYYSLNRMADQKFVNRHEKVDQGAQYLGSDRPAIPLGIDGDEQRKFRRLLDPVFTARRVAPLEVDIRRLAGELIDRFLDDGEVDAFARWCEPLPSTIFLSIMGLPMDRLHDFIRFKDLTLGGATLEEVPHDQRLAKRAEAVAWLHGYFNDDLDRRADEHDERDDMIGWLIASEVDGHRLSRQEILDILGLLMIAGLDTVTASLACFLSYFARHPEDRAKVLADPDIWTSAVEELLRFESPVADGFRIAQEELTLPSGVTLPKGAMMHLSWHAANLDPTWIETPLTVDLTRKVNPHIAFASGFHRCLGSHLARMELRVALQVWHERIPDYRIKPGEQLIYSGNPRAPHKLPLVW